MAEPVLHPRFVLARLTEALRAHLKYEIDTLGGLLVKAGVKAN